MTVRLLSRQINLKWTERLKNSTQNLQTQNPKAKTSGIDLQVAEKPLVNFHKLLLAWCNNNVQGSLEESVLQSKSKIRKKTINGWNTTSLLKI